MRYFSFLESKNIGRIHEAPLEILSEVGLMVRNKKARARIGHIVNELTYSLFRRGPKGGGLPRRLG